jgi:hypothetical protein
VVDDAVLGFTSLFFYKGVPFLLEGDIKVNSPLRILPVPGENPNLWIGWRRHFGIAPSLEVPPWDNRVASSWLRLFICDVVMWLPCALTLHVLFLGDACPPVR